MRRHYLRIIGLLLSSYCSFAQNNIVLQPDLAKDTISPLIYGQFAEHLGRCVYGGLYVGDTSHIPNRDGIRLDVIQALKDLKVPILRWPGGCFADNYHWKDAVGPKEKRPNVLNTSWGDLIENNAFGTHEFLELCQLIGAEPYLAGNVGSGTVKELQDWVQYVNTPESKGPMAKWRKENGKKDAWNVKYWGVGNEAWGCGGNMIPEYYANLYKQYATFMTDYDNSKKLFRIASGANNDDFHWTEVLMRDLPQKMVEGIALHHYAVIDWGKKGSATNFSEADYFKTMHEALLMDSLIHVHETIMDKYDKDKKVALVVDEWGGWYEPEPNMDKASILYQQNTMRDAMIAGVTLNIFQNHCDRVRIANLAQIVNVLQAVILTKGDKIIKTPTYYVMQLFNVHQGAIMIPLKINGDSYKLDGKQLPAISASASRNAEGAVHISLVNIDSKANREVTLDLADIKSSKITAQILRSAHLQDYNSFEQPELIHPQSFSQFSKTKNQLKISLPPFSVIVLNLQ